MSDSVLALIGGALVGVSASLYLLTHGKIAGVSGIYGGALRGTPDRAVRVAFVAGLVLAGAVLGQIFPSAFEPAGTGSLATVVAAGLLVGFGTQLGNGCTSGHGVCGISRLSVRSLVATAAFITAGATTVFVVRHLLGGSV